MADNDTSAGAHAEETKVYTVEEYIRGLSSNANVSEDTVKGVLADAGIEAGTPYSELTEKDRDLSQAYFYIRLAMNPIQSQRVTDRDGDWEHSEGSEHWSPLQMQQLLLLARDLLKKWGITDQRISSLAPKWGFRGTGLRYRRRNPK